MVFDSKEGTWNKGDWEQCAEEYLDQGEVKWQEVSESCIMRSSLPSIYRMAKLRRMRWAGHVARIGAKPNVVRLLVGEPEGKRLHGIWRHRWWIMLKWILERKGRGGGNMEWIGLAQDRNQVRTLVNTIINFAVHTFLGSFWAVAQLLVAWEGFSSVEWSVSSYVRSTVYRIILQAATLKELKQLITVAVKGMTPEKLICG
jgi:hypothetical protein